ncbi:hypothetical protein B0A50_06365 [Salinomyces thailandicus]|uniref:Nuclear condensin complex subunit 3 C-terminal domain-containing protein n=1 Tax=Salinomyces thailandicus TaxID=706561 RepID=A0A4U0TS51_9PEZI|nr:hypothetical protein B0A50_06365 [Salinomyces thailandica]
MPGRIARGARSSATTTAARKTTRNSSPTTEIPDEGADTSLRRDICRIFSDAQKSTAGHRKAVIALRKIQEACCYEPVNFKKGKQQEDFDVNDFNTEIKRCLLRILAVRKAESAGDRVVRFLGTYLNVASQKDNEIASAGDPDATSALETPTSGLTSEILQMLLPLLSVKDKTIRFRATQITSHIIHSVDTLDENIFHQVRLALLKRIHDKEAPVRLQAVYGLGRVAAEVNPDEEKDDSESEDDDGVGQGVLEKLLNILQNDPAAEVRRNLLLNLPLNKEVLPYLLERARDADGSTRRALYARLLPALGDFRYLSLTHREKLLRWGLRDRDENVRKATARLFRERWIEDCAAMPADQAAQEEEGGEGKKPANQAADPSLDALLELLERIDVVNSGTETGIALTAMREFWEGRPDYVDYVSFPDTFWEDLSPELSFVARTFNDYCRTSGREDGYDGPRMLDAMVEEKLPEVTKFGFLLERELNRLLEAVQASAEDEDEEGEMEEERVQREFVVEQMLQMALTFDYSDEVGRRKMFQLMRTALAHAALPEESTRLVVELLRSVCGRDAKGEREFCQVVMEAVAEVHDTIMDDDDDDDETEKSTTEDSFHSATEHLEDSNEDGSPQAASKKKKSKQEKNLTPEEADHEQEKAMREIMINMKVLHIALCMLQNVGGELEDNANLVTMLNNLVVPAVRSKEAPVRERGFVCLGLCCLLNKNLAEENLNLFLHGFARGHPGLQTITLQILADILLTHPSLLAIPPSTQPLEASSTEMNAPAETNPHLKPLLKALTKSLKSPSPAVQATGATALAKLLLPALLPAANAEETLKHLVLTYFDPDTASNAQLRQSLTYFLPVYCHSRAENAERMVNVACGALGKLAVLRETLQDEADAAAEEAGVDEGMVKLSVVGQMLVDWTDPRKVVGFADAAGAAVGKGAAETHFVLAEQILERLVTSQVGKEERKVLLSMLGKLYLPEGGCGGELLATLLELVTEALESGVAVDAAGRNALGKLKTVLLRMMHDVMTVERGGGGAEETVVGDETEVAVRAGAVDATEMSVGGGLGEEQTEGQWEESVVDLQKTMRDTTIGAPDAEGTRVQLGGGSDDTSLLDDDEDEDEDAVL